MIMTRDIDDLFNAPAAPARVAPTAEQILSALHWTEPKEVPTRLGPRLVSNADPSPEFFALYRDRPQFLRERGYTYGFNSFLKREVVTFWQLVPEKVIVERKAAIEMSRATDAVIEVPAPDGLNYLGYQKAGIAFGLTRPAVLIGDEMGLGKTVETIGIMNADPTLKRILIICPASLKLNWRRELERWLVKSRPILIADSKLFAAFEGITIINYDVLHRHIDEIRCNVWDMLIVDEAHYLKNRRARRSTMVFGHKATKSEKAAGMADVPRMAARKKIFLTGTPIANRPAELFPIINYLDSAKWPNFWSFARRYCAGHSNGYGFDADGASNLDELQEKLRSTIMIRRLKKDVLTELPPKRRQIIEFSATGEAKRLVAAERRAYEAKEADMERMQARVELAKADENEQEYRAAVEALKKGMAGIFGELSTIRRETVTAKCQMPEIIEHIEEAVEESSKVIIFAHHKAAIAILADKFGDACVTLVGDTAMQDRQDAVDRFQKDPSCKVFIGSIMAAGVGITLTASSHVIFVEGDWVPGNLSQAEDRAHRIGQAESVLVQHLVLEESIDATILRRVIGKQEVIDKALDKAAVVDDEAPVKVQSATAGTTREKIASEALKLTEADIKRVHQALQYIAGRCNGAVNWDGAGFSKLDTVIGKDLAARPYLSPKQAALGKRIAWKYRGQMPEAMQEGLK
jgi:SWI/SNF-related matrix-associated actin-dependent regulator 1 of chromatin subfamily A